jgi:hypothetical protein
VEEYINIELPGLCSKLLDGMIRGVNYPAKFGNISLAKTFEEGPWGILTMPYT